MGRANEVAEYLRTSIHRLSLANLTAGTTARTPLYLMLDLDPATRYMHYGTVLAIRSPDDRIKKQVVREVAESRQRYVVSDLKRATHDHSRAYAPGRRWRPTPAPRVAVGHRGGQVPVESADRVPFGAVCCSPD